LNPFKTSFTIAQNFSLGSDTDLQRVGAYGFKTGDVSGVVYNDQKWFFGDRFDRWFSGGGNFTIANFMGTDNALTFGNDVYTGASVNIGEWWKYDENETEYSYGLFNEKTLRYAGQSTFDTDISDYNQSLNMGETYFQLSNSQGFIGVSHSGKFDMFSQNSIHDAMNFHRFLSTTENQFNVTGGYNGYIFKK